MAGNAEFVNWMGNRTYTLKDMLRPNLRAVIVGINPSPVSVDAGHYYQGVLGRRLFSRFRSVGLFPERPGWEDDFAFERGIGFTDLVKRPTASANEVTKAEKEFGRRSLLEKIAAFQPQLVVFSFKEVARICLGTFKGNGVISSAGILGVRCFVMPGPYEAAATAEATLSTLPSLIERD